MSEEIRSRIKGIVTGGLDLDESEIASISNETPLLGSGLGLDSLEAVAIATAIESEFDIFIEDEELNADLFRNIKSLSDFVLQRLEATASSTV